MGTVTYRKFAAVWKLGQAVFSAIATAPARVGGPIPPVFTVMRFASAPTPGISTTDEPVTGWPITSGGWNCESGTPLMMFSVTTKNPVGEAVKVPPTNGAGVPDAAVDNINWFAEWSIVVPLSSYAGNGLPK